MEARPIERPVPYHPMLGQRIRPRTQIPQHELVVVPYFGEELVVPVQPQLESLLDESGDAASLTCRGGKGKGGPAIVLVEGEEIETAKLGRGVDIVVRRAWAIRTSQQDPVRLGERELELPLEARKASLRPGDEGERREVRAGRERREGGSKNEVGQVALDDGHVRVRKRTGGQEEEEVTLGY